MRKKAAPPAPTPVADAAISDAVDALPDPAPAAAPVPAVTPVPVVAPAPPPPAGLADVALGDLDLSARIAGFAKRRGLSTLRELARISPPDLRGERNLGRRSIAEMRAAITEHLGAPWEIIAAGMDAVEPPEKAPEDEGPPPAVPHVALDELDLPARMANWARRRGLSTLLDLVRIAPADLLAEEKMGELTIHQTRVVVESRLGCSWERAAGAPAPPRARREAQAAQARQFAERQQALADAPLLDAWKSRVVELEERHRAILVAHLGTGGRGEPLIAVARRLGLPEGTVKTLEQRAVALLRHERAWLLAARARGEVALEAHGGAAPLSTLAEDPWWAGITAAPRVLDFFGRRLLDGAWRVVRVEERLYLARCSPSELDQARQALQAGAAQVTLPAPLATFRALLDPWAPRLHAALTEVLFERLRAELLVDETGGAPRVTARVTAQEASLLAVLHASPVPIRPAHKREGASWVSMPGDVLRLGYGLLGLPRHFPSYEAWRELLVPAAIRVMEGGSPERQWLAEELRGRLAEALDIPAWLTEYHLGSLLARSGKVRYLGHMKVALLRPTEDQASITVGKELVRILRARGAPMMRRELAEELRRRTGASEEGFSQGLRQASIVRLERNCYGLVDRDLPGRSKAIAKAAAHVAALLEQRGRGLGAGPLQEALAGLSPAHARWSRAMCLSALHGDPRFVQSSSLAVGLSSWESVRLPSREDLTRACLERGHGRVRLATLKRRIEEVYGEPPSQQQIWAMAYGLGARVASGWMVLRETEGEG